MSAMNLDTAAVRVARLLTTEYKGKGVTADYLAKEIGFTSPHVRRALETLEQAGVVKTMGSPLYNDAKKAHLPTKLENFEELDHRTKLHFSTITYEQLRQIWPDLSKLELAKNMEAFGDLRDPRTKIHYAVASFEDLMKIPSFRRSEESLQKFKQRVNPSNTKTDE
jgi:predicted transcriptional regulator